MSTFDKFTREEIRALITKKYRTAGGTRPDLALVELDGRKAVVKDFRCSDKLFSRFIGPILISREYAALSRLRDVSGIPQLIKRIDRYALMIEHIDGISLDVAQPEDLPSDYFDLLKPVIGEIHQRGITHCDLRSRGNLMVGSDGKPYVVDFAACVLRGRGFNPFINWLFKQFVIADNHAVLMAKKRLVPHLLTQKEEEALAIPLPYEEKAKALGKWFRNTTRRLLTKKSR